MSEVKRYHVTEAGLVEGSALGRINVVLASDYDAAVTHIRDLELLAGQEMKSTELATNAGLRVCLERDALQALLTAADERANVMETALAGMLFAFDDGVGRDWSAPLLDFARKLTTAKEFKAALKPAEGNGSTCNQIREETGLPINRPCKACNDSACIDR